MKDETYVFTPSAPPSPAMTDQYPHCTPQQYQEHPSQHQDSVIHGSNDKGLLQVPDRRPQHHHPVFVFPSPIPSPSPMSTPLPMIVLDNAKDSSSHHEDLNNNDDPRPWTDHTKYKRTQYSKKLLEIFPKSLL